MKKIIAVMVALMCAAVLFNINVSALTSQEYEQEILGLLYDLKNGYITPEQYEQYENEVTTRFIESNTDGSGVVDTVAENISNTVKSITEGIGEAVQKTGDNFKDWLSDIFDDFETQESVSTTDKKGYKTMIHCKRIGYDGQLTGSELYYYSDGYIVVYPQDDGTTKYTHYYNGYDYYTIQYNSSGKVSVETTGVGESNVSYTTDRYVVYVYGDVRYADGSDAPTDDDYTTQDTLDLTGLTDNELDELLNDILEELERQNPDLSTIEGLLEAIYYRLGSLDSDNDNALLSDINTAILALANDGSNEEMIEILLEIRDGLKNGDSGTSEDENTDEDSGETGDSSETSDGHPDHICGTVYNVKPLDKNWLNKLFTDATELKVEYQGSKYYLQSCGCLLLDDKYYSVDMNYDSYTNIDYDFNNTDIEVSPDITTFNYVDMNLTDGQKKKIDNIVEMIGTLISKGIPMSAVNGGLMFYQDIIFNSSDPKDLVIDLEFYGKQYSFTILSTSFFNEEAAQALQIVKNFVSIVICYAWLLSMRRKVSGMMG